MQNPVGLIAFISILVLAYIAYLTGIPIVALLDAMKTLMIMGFLGGLLIYFTNYKSSSLFGTAAIFWLLEGRGLMLAKANVDKYLAQVPLSWSPFGGELPWYTSGIFILTVFLILAGSAIWLFIKESR